MFYDLDGLETYLNKIIEDYMEFGVIESDTKLEISELIIPDIITLSELKSEKNNQKKELSTIYLDDIEEELLIEKIEKVTKQFNKSEDHKKIIKSLIDSYRLTCFLIAKQIYENE